MEKEELENLKRRAADLTARSEKLLAPKPVSPTRRILSVIAHWGFAAFCIFLVVRAIVQGEIHARQLAQIWPGHVVLRADEPALFWFSILLFLALTGLLVWNGWRIYLNKANK
jgi:hypothetical protein